MDSIYFAAFLSFLVGAFGYFITRFWIIPVVRYRIAKRRLVHALAQVREHLPPKDNDKLKAGPGRDLFAAIRRHCFELADLVNDQIPYWYRLVLLSRKEDPLKACEPAQKLDTCADGGQVRRKLAELQALMGLKA